MVVHHTTPHHTTPHHTTPRPDPAWLKLKHSSVEQGLPPQPSANPAHDALVYLLTRDDPDNREFGPEWQLHAALNSQLKTPPYPPTAGQSREQLQNQGGRNTQQPGSSRDPRLKYGVYNRRVG